MDELRSRLNPSQYQAVTTIQGPVLVLAGAGSGKTRVIEYRVLHLLKNQIDPSSILLLTFTRKAAREMLGRAEKHEPKCKAVEGGTFHSFAYKILREYASLLGFSVPFSILDPSDGAELLEICAVQLGFRKKKKRFPKKETLRDILSMSLNQKRPLEEVVSRSYPQFIEYSADLEKLREEYTQSKIEKNYLDYDDFLLYLKLLLEEEEIRKDLASRYRYVMVDEYQDTNFLQGRIAQLLGMEHQNIMVVGDDAQSIYGFRGAYFKNIIYFPKNFSDCKIIKLEENYRSTQSILDLANASLREMKYSYSKCLKAARKVVGEKAQFLFFRDGYEEAQWVAEKIKESRDEGVELKDQAVLFRSGFVSIPLQAELSKIGIPFILFGGRKFYETAHVKDLLAHVKILFNPRDELAWNRVLNLIPAVGPKSAEKLLEEIRGSSQLSKVLDRFGNHIKQKYYDGLSLLKGALEEASGERKQPQEILGALLEYYTPLFKSQFDDWNNRIKDLAILHEMTSQYASLEDFLRDFALEPVEWGLDKLTPKHAEEKPLILSTIHSAKGLEWKRVYLIGLVEGVLPSSLSIANEEDLEEEHRLFYVAITRAKDGLFLTFPHQSVHRKGFRFFNKLTRFLEPAPVLSKVDQIGSGPPEKLPPSLQEKKEGPLFDRKELFKKIRDSWD